MSELTFCCRHAYRGHGSIEASFVSVGPVTALVGPSGCGKTTVLHVIAGLLRPQFGRVRLGERVLFDSQRDVFVPPEHRRIGLVFQEYRLFPHLSVKANLAFGMPGKIRRSDLFEQLVDALELEPLLNRRPHTLSGGQCQRVAIGRALVREPELLLLDEPFSSLNVELRQQTVHYMHRLARQMKLHVIVVTHDPADVRAITTQTIRMGEPMGNLDDMDDPPIGHNYLFAG